MMELDDDLLRFDTFADCHQLSFEIKFFLDFFEVSFNCFFFLFSSSSRKQSEMNVWNSKMAPITFDQLDKAVTRRRSNSRENSSEQPREMPSILSCVDSTRFLFLYACGRRNEWGRVGVCKKKEGEKEDKIGRVSEIDIEPLTAVEERPWDRKKEA